ncbi:signal peptide peptidase SppA [Fulvivirga sp. 29W222]|uniref:Signal peptide peptidase SppA n=1 Tax=Fulvivirga marina TaxID=2494733 RepID=A0A937FTB6_9BACT|nr:signal peptide peptidase SppA [Fulvivirga marina]MBL6445274.1 signal peptide peptidase SppA [Fulvivirga marina]
MNFLRNLLASFLALVIFSVLAVLMFIGILGALTQKEPVTVSEKSILHIKLNRPISEVEFNNPLAELEMFPTAPATIGLVQLKEAIRHAKNNDKIKGIYLEAPYVMAGMAATEEIRDALSDFKSSGKFVVAFSELYTEAGYYLASVADKVYMHPEGSLEFNGLSSNLTFFKGMFDKLDIEPQIFRVGDFKSAVEPFMRKDMSEENRFQLTSMLNSINGNMISKISESRGIAPKKLIEISNNMLVRRPKQAVEYHLADGLVYFDQVVSELKEEMGVAEDEDLKFISYGKYKESFSTYTSSDNEVAVIVASGDIVPGKGDVNKIGSEKFSEEIRKARKDDDVKAIVIRINSPGGSFVASDVMWREIKLATEEKPVIASMSDVAASGGYYMAMACDTIVAQPNTITGSIGIFGIIFNLQGFLNNKLGITNDEVKTGNLSTIYNMTRPLTDQEKQIIQNDVEDGYETFVTKAAEGRGMNVGELKKIASGRVWTGSQAKANGLVDILGDLEVAIEIAAQKAKVYDDYKVRYYPKQQSIFEKFVKELEGEGTAKMVKEELGEFYPYLESAKKIKELNGLQTRMPYEFQLN